MSSIIRSIIILAIVLAILWFFGWFKVYKQTIYCIKAPCPGPVWMIQLFGWQYQLTKVQ